MITSGVTTTTMPSDSIATTASTPITYVANASSITCPVVDMMEASMCNSILCKYSTPVLWNRQAYIVIVK